MNKFTKGISRKLPLWAALLPIIVLLSTLVVVICTSGADGIADLSPWALLGAATIAIIVGLFFGTISKRSAIVGFRRSARQILPTVPMLICIAMVSTTWMLSGVVPTLIDLGLRSLSPQFFLVLTCIVCSIVSVLTGSSWSTIATIGVAFMGIGSILGFHPGWVAGAIISGAYFGDKVSPLSDTTVVASSACGVDLFKHIRYLMITTAPSMMIALIVYTIVGLLNGNNTEIFTHDIMASLETTFRITPLTLIIPAITFSLILARVPTIPVLFISAMLGLGGIFVFQPDIVAALSSDTNIPTMIGRLLWSETIFNTGSESFDNLISTSGIMGMLPTIFLILCAMMLGMALISCGMLARITEALARRLKRRFSIVASTVVGGLFLNSTTADQYLSLIVGGNMFRDIYRARGFEPRLLSRTLEDSVSVTSVLIPWNSCGITQSTVLGVSTLIYFPFCIFNYLSPLMSLLMAWIGFKIKNTQYAQA